MAINLAKDFVYDELCSRNPDQWMVKTLFSTVADQGNYAWPAAVKRMDVIGIPDATGSGLADLLYTAVMAADHENRGIDHDTPVFWRSGAEFWMDPAPGVTGTNNAYYRYVANLADLVKEIDALTMPQGMIDVVMLRAAWDLAMMGGYKQAIGLEVLYGQHLNAAVGQVRTTKADGRIRIDG